MSDTLQIFKLPSTQSSIHKLENLIESFCCEQPLITKEQYGNILIASTEAFNNALHHGNQNNPRKVISVEIEISNTEFIITVSDEGNGFDIDKVADPTLPENLLKETGRGIFIMKALADQCTFLDNGKTVRLKFKI